MIYNTNSLETEVPLVWPLRREDKEVNSKEYHIDEKEVVDIRKIRRIESV